ncbi:MAG: WD40 repeat domain-containing protein [Acidobacteriota bacterium]
MRVAAILPAVAMVLPAYAGAPGVSRELAAGSGGSQLVRSVTDGPPRRALVAASSSSSAGRAGSILWTVLEVAADIDREDVAISGDGASIAAGWWLNDMYIAHYQTTGNGTPIWTYPVTSSFFVPVDIGTTNAVIAGTTGGEPLYQWGPASNTPTYTHPYTGTYQGAHCAVAPDGSFIAGGSTDSQAPNGGAVQLYDAATGSLLWEDFTLATATQGLDVSADGSRLAGNEYATVNVWDVATSAKISTFALPGNTQTIARLSSNGDYLVFGNFSGHVRIYHWDPPTSQYVSLWNIDTLDDWITAIDISDDARTVMAGTLNFTTPYTGSVHLIDPVSGAIVWSDTTYGDYVQSVALSADGLRGVASSWGGYQATTGNIVAVYDRASSTPVFAIPDDSVPGVGSAFAAAISDDGRYAAVGGKAVHARDFGSGGWLMALDVPIVLPVITDVCPEGAQAGQVNAPLRISGQNFAAGATVSTSAPGIIIGSVTVTPTLVTALATIPGATAPASYDVTVQNPDLRSATAAGAFTIVSRPADLVAAPGAGPTNAPRVLGFTAAGTPIPQIDFLAYGSTGYGANVASGDVNGGPAGADYAEVVTGPGPGANYGPQVRAFDRTGTPLAKINYYAYGTLRYGVHVAAGDLDCDGYAEIVTGAGPGGVFGPHVRGWNYDGAVLSSIAKISYFAYGTLKYGVHPERGDVERDVFEEILTGPGPGAVFGPQVRGWNYDGAAIASIGKINFNAFATTSYGASATGADVDQDGYGEIVAGIGPGPAFTADVAGFQYDDTAIAAIPGYAFTTIPGALFGSSFVRAGDAGADGDDEVATGAGPDPAQSGQIVVIDTAVGAPIPAFTTTYGVKTALTDMGY